MDKVAIDNVMKVYNELKTVLSEDKQSVFDGTTISGQRPGFVSNPNGAMLPRDVLGSGLNRLEKREKGRMVLLAQHMES